MLFNSYAFIFLFLPVTLLGYLALARRGRRLASAWLAAASLFFYGWWDAPYVALLALSIVYNYAIGIAIAKLPFGHRARRPLLVLGIAGDLLVLAYFKYFNFLLGMVAALVGGAAPQAAILLPIGISFFTFTQIAFLTDAYAGKAREYDPVDYTLFVTFFPHLLAGPLLHHKEMMPQFADPETARPRAENLSVGLTIFIIGLVKKVVIADAMAELAAPAFAAAAAGTPVDLIAAWGAALAYAFQLYFDFSGYSDMAIGGARCFGIRLPLNFHSPYKATSITEFWRRWHMTLSRFLRDYLYIPLGGNRHGRVRRYLNLFATMVLGGLWHGAAWNFVLWGALHGAFLIVNHGWRALRERLGWAATKGPLGHALAVALTFTLVVIAWVPFRAPSFAASGAMLAAMAGANGIAGAGGAANELVGIAYGAVLYRGIDQSEALALVALLVFLAPNTQQIMGSFRPALPHSLLGAAPGPLRLRWQPRPAWSLVMVLALLAALSQMSGISPFLYYQF